MGNCCLRGSQYESVVDNVFKSVLAKGVNLQKLLDEFDKKEYIIETDFQVIINKHLLVDEFKENLYDYWTDFYRKKKVDLQVLLLKINFYLLFGTIKTEVRNKIEQLFKKYREYKKEEVKNDKLMRLEDIAFLIQEYITSISYTTIDNFKNLHSDPVAFVDKLQKLWDRTEIDNFVKKTFCEIKDSNINTKIEVDVFLNKNIGLLMDSFLLRKLLTDYSIKNMVADD
jgi:hypothetical protein